MLDFETTGLSPDHGDRAIEIGAVIIEKNEITASFQSLMNPGFPKRRFHHFLKKEQQRVVNKRDDIPDLIYGISTVR